VSEFVVSELWVSKFVVSACASAWMNELMNKWMDDWINKQNKMN